MHKGSDRFYVRLTNDDQQPAVVIDEQVTGSDGGFKLCYGDGDLQTIPDFFVVHMYSAYALNPVSDQSPPVLQVLLPDSPAEFNLLSMYHVFTTPIESNRSPYEIPDPLEVAAGFAGETAFRIKDDLQTSTASI